MKLITKLAVSLLAVGLVYAFPALTGTAGSIAGVKTVYAEAWVEGTNYTIDGTTFTIKGTISSPAHLGSIINQTAVRLPHHKRVQITLWQ